MPSEVGWPDVYLPGLLGLLMLTSGYALAGLGLAAACFLLGAILGGAGAQLVLEQLQVDVQHVYWWIPLAAAGTGGLLSALLLRKMARFVLFLACLVGGALFFHEALGHRYTMLVGNVDLAPVLAGVVVAVVLYIFRKTAIVLLTSLWGAVLVIGALDAPPAYIWVAAVTGVYVQYVVPYLDRRRRYRLAGE